MLADGFPPRVRKACAKTATDHDAIISVCLRGTKQSFPFRAPSSTLALPWVSHPQGKKEVAKDKKVFARQKYILGGPGHSFSYPRKKKKGAKEKNKCSKGQKAFWLSSPHTPRKTKRGRGKKSVRGQTCPQPRREKQKGFGEKTLTK